MPHRLNSFLNSSSELGQLANKARQLMALQQQLEQVIPPSLRSGCRVLQLKDNKLTLSADNGAIASKLRQMSTELAAKLHDIGCKITLIQVVVQVNAPAYIPPHEIRSVSPTGKAHLAELAGTLEDSPLKEALNRLAKRQ